MKKAYAFLGILLAVILNHSLYAEDRERERGDREARAVDFEQVAKELKQAVEEGKISKEDARRRLAALRERVDHDQKRKPKVGYTPRQLL